MKINILKTISLCVGAFILVTSCVGDLDVTPIDPRLETPDKVLTSETAFAQVLAKIYAGFILSGQEGPAGDGDLKGFDEGHSQYWRGYFVCQELPTEEAVNGWNDGNLPKMSQVTWGAENEFIRSFYYRVIYQTSIANEFLRQANAYGKEEYTNMPTYRAEARFLRALAYYHALDMFGNGIPFTTEADPIGAFKPMPAGEVYGPELFNYIEAELLAILGETDDKSEVLLDARSTVAGRADKGAGYMLLAKLYLNHEVYLQTKNNAYYTAGLNMVNKLIAAGYRLIDESDVAAGDKFDAYQFLFLGDNYKSSDEIIFSFFGDARSASSYGAMTYILNASIGGAVMSPSDYGTADAWGGNRTTEKLVDLFDPSDKRALWFTEGQEKTITQQDLFTEGYAVIKFKNLTRDGQLASSALSGFNNIGIPVFRLADAYLMAAELELRLGGAVSGTSQTNLQKIRSRAGLSGALPNVDLQYILDERARELYWECHRRTDLVRFGKFTKGYDWPLKGNDLAGRDVDDKYNLMPIPNSDINANTNLKQNPRY